MVVLDTSCKRGATPYCSAAHRRNRPAVDSYRLHLGLWRLLAAGVAVRQTSMVASVSLSLQQLFWTRFFADRTGYPP